MSLKEENTWRGDNGHLAFGYSVCLNINQRKIENWMVWPSTHTQIGKNIDKILAWDHFLLFEENHPENDARGGERTDWVDEGDQKIKDIEQIGRILNHRKTESSKANQSSCCV